MPAAGYEEVVAEAVEGMARTTDVLLHADTTAYTPCLITSYIASCPYNLTPTLSPCLLRYQRRERRQRQERVT